MQSHFSDAILQTIKDRLMLSDVIKQKISLKQKGKDFIGLCPFHNEKSPSFTVNDLKGFYHCFGCGAHGDILSFLTGYEKLSFVEAVEYCSNLAGIPLEKLSPKQERQIEKKKQVFEVLSDVSLYFNQILLGPGKENYLSYLKDRGITDSSIEKFCLGYARKGATQRFLTQKGLPQAVAESSGLLVKTDYGLKERFFERLTFPIFDEKKRVVGFGARTLDDHVQPKYLNSPESIIFHKGSLLYGLHLLNLKRSTVILVEGYLDVIALIQAGYENVLAPMGTSVTQDQDEKVLKHFTQIILCFDGDEAGLKAMARAVEVFIPLLKAGIELKFVILPRGHDPHSMSVGGQSEAMKCLLECPLGITEFLIYCESQSHSGDSPAIKALKRKNILDIYSKIEDKFLQSLYKSQVFEAFRSKGSGSKVTPRAEIPMILSIQNVYEKVLIQTLIQFPKLFEGCIEKIHTISFSKEADEVLKLIENYFFSGESLEFSILYTYIKERASINIDQWLEKSVELHAPHLKDHNEDKAKAVVIDIFSCMENTMLLDQHIREAQELFKETQDPKDWERLKLLMIERKNQKKFENE